MAHCEKLNYNTLAKMANRARILERRYRSLGIDVLAHKYHKIWCRISISQIEMIKNGGLYL